MEENPVVLSVVIPTYNTASMTLRCVRALKGADEVPVEVMVVDDGSTDDTVALLSAEARVISLEKNSGFAVAANRGVAASRGDLVLLLNSDAIVEPGAISAFVAAFEADPKLGVAGAQLLNEDGSKQWSGGRTPTLPWIIGVVSGAGHLARLFRRRKSKETTRAVDWVSGAAMMFRRDAWKPLDERYLFYCQDIDFCLDARKAGWNVRIVDEARVTHGLGRTVARGSGRNLKLKAAAFSFKFRPDPQLSYDPARLWPDLLTWGRNYYGQAWASKARVVLIAVAALRIAWRKVRLKSAEPFVRGLTALRKT